MTENNSLLPNFYEVYKFVIDQNKQFYYRPTLMLFVMFQVGDYGPSQEK